MSNTPHSIPLKLLRKWQSARVWCARAPGVLLLLFERVGNQGNGGDSCLGFKLQLGQGPASQSAIKGQGSTRWGSVYVLYRRRLTRRCASFPPSPRSAALAHSGPGA